MLNYAILKGVKLATQSRFRLGVKTLRNKKQTGFTLIELLVVIAIIGLLASVVLLALNSARGKARDAKRLADVRQMQSALELYYNDCGGYPPQPAQAADRVLGSANALVLSAVTPTTSGGACTTAGWAASVAGVNPTTYIAKVSASPTPADGVCVSPGTNDYTYTSASTSTYNIAFCLGAPAGGLGSGVRNATPGSIQ